MIQLIKLRNDETEMFIGFARSSSMLSAKNLQSHSKKFSVLLLVTLALASCAQTPAERRDFADKRLEEAREKAEVDPVGLMTAEFDAATAHGQAGDPKGARQLAIEAMHLYATIPSINARSIADIPWRYVETQLRQAKIKQDESIAYEFVDATERSGSENKSDSQAIEQIAGYFGRLNRRDDEIAFLEYGLRKRIEAKQPLESVTELATPLIRTYRELKQTEKLTQLEKTLESLSTGENVTDPSARLGVLLQGACIRFDANHAAEGERLLKEALSIAETNKAKLSSPNYDALADLVSDYVQNGEYDKAEKLLKKSYELAETGGNDQDNMKCFSSTISFFASTLEREREFERAELVLKMVREHSKDDPRSTDNMLDGLYMRWAAVVNDEGKTAEAKRLLAKSDQAFQAVLSSCHNATSVDSLKKGRQKALESLNLSPWLTSDAE